MTDNKRERIEQSNDVADIVFTEVKKVWPDLHPVLDIRYGIADALWAAGFRRSVVPEPSDEEAQALKAVRGWVRSSGPGVRVLRVLLAMAERSVYQKGHDDAKR